MLYRVTLFPLLLLCLMFVPAFGASEASPAFVRALLSPPPSGDDVLRVMLEPDEPLCREAYGEAWGARCFASVGQKGAPVGGVRLQPEVSGDWRWADGRTMTFRPKEPWPAAASFELIVDDLPLPSRVKLTSPRAVFSTPPLTAYGMDAQMWIDPDLNGERAVTFDIAFSTPPDRSLVERDARIIVSDAALRLAEPQFIWSGNTKCLVRSRILSLGEKPAVVTMVLPGVAAEVRLDGTRWIVPEGQQEAAAQVTVPGMSTLFFIKKAALEPAKDRNLVGEYRLTLETSLLVRPDALAGAMTALRLPRVQDEGAVSPTVWTAAPVIDEETLSRAVPVALDLLQQADVPSDRITFRVKAEPDSYLLFELPRGFGPSQNFSLASPWREVFHAAPFGPELEFLQPGNVLSLGGARRLDIHSSGLTAVRWRASRVLDPFLGLLAAQSAPFSGNEIPFDAVSDVLAGVMPLQRTEPGVPQFSVFDVTPLLRNGRGLVQLELTGMDGDREVVSTRRFLLMTDMGMIVKKGASGGRDVFVCSLSSGKPISGAKVDILGVNGRPVAEAVTDADGRAVLPSVSGLDRERRPVAVTAWKKSGSGEDMAWLPLDDESRRVDLSRFPTQGQTSQADGVNAYVFSQRGLFRPGETMHFGMLLRRGDWKALPSDMPFVAELVDPAEHAVLRRMFTVGADGMAALSWNVPEGASAGRYRLDVRTPDAQGMDVVLGSATVRVEEFQPDTMNLSLALSPDPGAGWLEASQGQVEATLRNLFGLPAADRRIRAQLSVWAAPLSFPGYGELTFHDAMPYRGSPLTLELGELRTDAEGKAVFPLPLEKLRGGTLHCRLLVEGFEPGGGRAVTEERRFLVSPLGYVLGFRPAGTAGNLDFVPQGSDAALEFVALGPDLAPADPGELSFRVSARSYVTSLVTDADGRYRYEDTPVDSVVTSSTQTFDADGHLRWTLPSAACGEFLLEVCDASGRSMARVPFTVAGNDDLRPATQTSLPSSSLRMHLDSTELSSGGKVKVFLSSPYEGTGLLTIERDNVSAWRWFHAPAGDSVQEIDVPEDFEGRAYVSVSLVRSLSSPDVFMNPYAFAVAPVSVNVGRRDMRLSLDVPSAPVKPGESIPVTLHAPHAGKAFLFAVDEGVLRLTAFPTPDPLRYLLRDRALEVETRQMFDMLMPEHGSFPLPAFGGDMGMAGGRFHNPFKRRNEPPMTFWSGLVDVKEGKQRFDIPVPGYYSGTVRVMAVGASPQTAGNAEADVVVRGDVVITPQLPVLASPGDVFEASVAVANNTSAALHAGLSLQIGEALRLVDAPSADITVEPGSELVLPFRVEAADVPGNAEITFIISGEGVEARRTASLSVRPASPLRESLRVGSTTSSMTLSTGRELYPYHAEGSASVSAMPLPALRGLVRYLESYPYSCVEQTVSRAMPYALLMSRPEFFSDTGRTPEETARLARERLDEALGAVESALTWRGVSLWPGGEPDLLVTAYAADFLLTMRENGAALPGGLLADVFSALERAVDRVPSSLEEGREQAYGLWVLTREGRITTRSLEQLIRHLEERFPGWREDVTSSLLAASCSVMRLKDDAEALLAMYRSPGADFRESRLDMLASLSLRASVLARQFPGKLEDMRAALVDELFDATNGGRYVSLSAALAVRALLDMEKAAPLPDGVTLRCARMQPGFEADSALPENVNGMLTLSAPGCGLYDLTVPEGSATLYWEASDLGFDRRMPEGESFEGMEVRRRYLDVEGLDVTHVRQGETVTVSVTARAYGGRLDDAVIIDMLPGGFEMELSTPVTADSSEVNESLLADRREDRMILFADLGTDTVTFTYRIRAVNRGVYAVPPVQGEAMYRRSVHAFSSGGSITVE